MAQGDTVPVDWELAGRTDPSMQQMLDAGVPMTRENYLDAYFDGNVPQEGNDELEMAVPPQLEAAGGDFSGVGASELAQGPLPIPEGRTGQGPQVGLKGEPARSQTADAVLPPTGLSPAPAKRRSALEPDQPIGQGSRFSQQAWKPPGSQ